MNNQFNEFEWIKKYFNLDSLKKENLENVLNFVLFWSAFESIVCDKNANVNSICNKVDELAGQEDLSYFKKYLNYFRQRYLLKDGKTNDRFDKLSFRNNDKKELVVKVLSKDVKDINNTVKALLIIIYRYRSNLFHGLKNTRTLNYQNENFKRANEILATFLEKWTNNNI